MKIFLEAVAIAAVLSLCMAIGEVPLKAEDLVLWHKDPGLVKREKDGKFEWKIDKDLVAQDLLDEIQLRQAEILRLRQALAAVTAERDQLKKDLLEAKAKQEFKVVSSTEAKHGH